MVRTAIMKLFVVSVLLVAVAADRLDNTYLPPNSAKTAGGSGNFLKSPFQGGASGAGGGRFGGAGSGSGPSRNYGAPSGSSGGRFGGSSSGSFGGSLSGGFGGAGRQGGVASGSSSGSGGRQGGGSSGNYAQSGGGRSGGGQSPDAGAAILRYENENFGDGTYRFAYETSNRISHEESGELKNAGGDQESSSVQGTFSYMGQDGNMYTLNYIADENGFQPSGDHLPTAPPIPEAILRSLEQNAAEEAQGGYQGGSQGGYQGGAQGGAQGGFGGSRGGAGGFQGGSRGGAFQGGSTQGGGRGGGFQPNKPSFNQQTGYQY